MPVFDGLSEEQKWATTPTFRGLPLLELSGRCWGRHGATKVLAKP